MGSGAVIYVPSFIKIGSSVKKLIGEIHIQTNTRTETLSHDPTLFFQNKESRLKNRGPSNRRPPGLNFNNIWRQTP
jgi:hypothetical protein